MRILYGILDNNIDVTEICKECLTHGYANQIIIPNGDANRAFYFTDPLLYVLKKIFIVNDDNTINEYSDQLKIIINTKTGTITTTNESEIDSVINNQLLNIHTTLSINHGSFRDELPEQKMSIRYLTGSEKVLEIGGNIGRNTLVIGSILKNINNNFVTLESDENIAEQLRENRDLNNMSFHIESSALSKRNLIQMDWNTLVSDIVLPGYKSVKSITFEQLNMKYNIEFDTLVLDCEGAFYYILMDMPEILTNIKLIIMENDYHDINHKIYIDDVLRQHNFYVDYSESGGWGPCYNNFFEVWKKNN